MTEPNAAPPPPEERWQNLARQEEQARRRRNLILTGAGAAGVGVIGLGALSMCGGPTTAPNDGKTAMDDVVQPYSPSPGPNEAPSNWQQINASGITFSLPATAVGPSPHPDWGLYTMSYDVPSSDQAGWHRVMISAADASTTAAGLRQTTDLRTHRGLRGDHPGALAAGVAIRRGASRLRVGLRGRLLRVDMDHRLVQRGRCGHAPRQRPRRRAA